MSPKSSLPRVSVCGPGAMGIGMPRNLIMNGFTVSGYEIVPTLVDMFVQRGGKATSSPKEAAEAAEVLLVIVINHFQVSSAFFHRIKTTDSSNGETGSGVNGKVVHQVRPEIVIALVAEVMALAVRAGLNTQTVYDHVQGGAGARSIMKNRITHALDGDETVYSAMTNGQKDLSIIVRTAGEKSVPVPLVAMAEQIYQTTVYIGWPGMDDSATWRLYLRDGPDDAVH
ncbi:hypothetical protein NCS56_01122200 [Fusarium sp. Ph1]|nr:hypothetical protein NCS56_01122200 [Fusarium sp. Ph1]